MTDNNGFNRHATTGCGYFGAVRVVAAPWKYEDGW